MIEESLFNGFLLNTDAGYIIAVGLLLVLLYAYNNFPLWLWSLSGYLLLLGLAVPGWSLIIYTIPVVLFNIPVIRRLFITVPLVKIIKAMNFLPAISRTERAAIEAGDIWVDGDIFSGRPDLKKIIKAEYPGLLDEEKAFLNGPVEELCAMINDWQVYQKRDLPPQAWNFIKENRFFGLIIPKEYGGHGFSPSANSAIVSKLSSRSSPLSITVMVPNSLGPAELLLHYGTQQQKDYYLPRLACGEEVPCFALTEPDAGSDAGSMKSNGVVFKGDDGELYLRLNWKKRYITLAAVSTILGLAFKLKDPENLLGKGENPGITCALIPTKTPGVNVLKRHDPLGVPFYNSPTEGKDVIVSVDAIIGGPEQAGNGWRMLMESLAAGRGISLPASATGGVKIAARVAGAYAAVRKQFGLSIGRFEGIEEPLARIAGFAYMLEAARRFTCSGLDSGQKPAVITAIAKYNFTEILRKSINDCMDILGGSGISLGPRNMMAHQYFAVPVNITVEGANILTRTLMIFGQGAIRCHPYVFKEIIALANDDLKGFDNIFWKHAGHVFSLKVRALLLSITRGNLALGHPGGALAKYYRKVLWGSASFAFLADLVMARFGGSLKRMEKITGRFADIFSWLYLSIAVLRRYETDGHGKEDLPLAEWCLQWGFWQIQQAIDGIYQNVGFPLKGPVSLWSRINPIGKAPDDKLGAKVARIIQTPGPQRNRITDGMYIPNQPSEALKRLDDAFELSVAADAIQIKIYKAIKSGKINKMPTDLLIKESAERSIISHDEADVLIRAEKARNDVIQVDAFTTDEYFGSAFNKKRENGEPVSK